MKKTLQTLMLLIFATSSSVYAQLDTLLYQDFEGSIENVLDFPDPDEVGTDNYVNWDQDGIADFNARPVNWYFALDFSQQGDSIAPQDTNVVLASSSWLADFAPGNRNWWVLPPMDIIDDQATLHWKSAPFQGPRYTDGYVVMVQDADFEFDEYTDTLFTVGQMSGNVPVGGADDLAVALDGEAFTYFPSDAYVHADKFSLDQYIIEDTAGFLYNCILEPHSVSLAAYAGKQIYIAFLHDSDDDNLISVDDILILGNEGEISGVEEDALDIRFVTYPNPTQNYINILYMLKEKSNVTLQIQDMTGKILSEQSENNQVSGEYTEKIDVRNWVPGQYNISIMVDGKVATKSFIKQ